MTAVRHADEEEAARERQAAADVAALQAVLSRVDARRKPGAVVCVCGCDCRCGWIVHAACMNMSV